MTALSLPAKPPADLCRTHATAWTKWRTHSLSYDPRNPKDWPGQHIMDSRTSHAERRRTWITKGREQLDLTENICRSGRSPQCNHGQPPAPAEGLVNADVDAAYL